MVNGLKLGTCSMTLSVDCHRGAVKGVIDAEIIQFPIHVLPS